MRVDVFSFILSISRSDLESIQIENKHEEIISISKQMDAQENITRTLNIQEEI